MSAGILSITLVVSGVERPCSLPYQGCAHVVADGVCPVCASTPLHVCGGSETIDYDTITARAYAACCKSPVGDLIVKVSTIFGIEEDRAVLTGRYRVY